MLSMRMRCAVNPLAPMSKASNILIPRELHGQFSISRDFQIFEARNLPFLWRIFTFSRFIENLEQDFEMLEN